MENMTKIPSGPIRRVASPRDALRDESYSNIFSGFFALARFYWTGSPRSSSYPLLRIKMDVSAVFFSVASGLVRIEERARER